ncbi:glycosyltransferase [Loigolactobacillus coryniformis]|uniref:glycosyltransferase family 2 protein n=2 Tax=Loigolactobacillus coryniformis TaxID=1610 RepID=UPI00201A9569|nr:glycosyltransferase family 2 protein [Loigolactobacillus coryniformis]MCL5457655.1 glycosyltransferase [Loigolactobacillus coryniformis]
MDTSIILSIIVPTYNAAAYIDQFINNVLTSVNMPSFEIIFVDDGSTDDTRDIILKAKRKYNNISFYEQKHQRQAAARNLGMQHAKGVFFSFLDVDDSFAPDMFMKMLDAIKKDNLVITGIWRVLSRNNKINESVSILQGITDYSELISRYLISRVEMDSGLWNKLFRADIIKKNQLQFTNKNFLEDTLFVFKYLLCINPETIVFINEPLYSYIKREQTTTTIFQRDMDELAVSFVTEIADCLEKGAFPNRLELISGIKIRTFVYVLHRHILDDSHWNARQQKKFYRNYLQIQTEENKLVPKKYKIGLFLINRLPTMYIRTYKVFKQSH